MPEAPLSPATRRQLEEYWRLKVAEAEHRYLIATALYCKAVEGEQPAIAGPGDALVLTAQVKSNAFAEYRRVLSVFTDLTLRGKLPEEGITADTPRLVAIVGVNETVRDIAGILLASADYAIRVYGTVERFLDSTDSGEAGCLIVDMPPAGLDELELRHCARVASLGVVVVLVVAHDARTAPQASVEGGAVTFLRRPFAAGTLLERVRNAMETRSCLP